MGKSKSWLRLFSLILVGLSFLVYGIHYLIFRDLYHIFFYMLIDVGFLFLNVLVVIIFIERLLADRERRIMIRKLNMVIGMFFSEVGLDLMKRFSDWVAHVDKLKTGLDFRPDWTRRDFQKAVAGTKTFPFEIRIPPASLHELNALLTSKRDFLIRLIENPNLLEHERFTDLLWSVFHLSEELAYRGGDFEGLPPADYDHLMTDARRAYSNITAEWLAYIEHLRANYPYLYSLAARINPFSQSPSPYIKS